MTDARRKEKERPPLRSLLTRPLIERHRAAGDIVIGPFEGRNLKTTSYDVRLGHWFFRERRHDGERRFFNPFDREHVRRYWGVPHEAVPAREWMDRNGGLANIGPDERLIVIGPGETILAHTLEFIGGRSRVSTEMRARSSMGRIGITVCKCAGWGDLGYVNRWTMEMTNHLRDSSVVLVEGMRVAQIIFYAVDPIPGTTYAGEQGKYQATDDLAELERRWTPYAMIPKLYDDFEVKDGFAKQEVKNDG